MAKQVTFTSDAEGLRYEFRIPSNIGTCVLEVVRKGRDYNVVRFELEGSPERTIGFRPSSPGVENLDTSSDAMDVFNVSTKVKYDTVVLGNLAMRAGSPEELAHALGAVKLAAFNHEEI